MALFHFPWNRALYLLTFVITVTCCQSLYLQSPSTRNGSPFSRCQSCQSKYHQQNTDQALRFVSKSTSGSGSRSRSTILWSVTPLTTYALIATASSPSPSNHHQNWYRISSILMALTAVGLASLTPSIYWYIHPSTYSNVQFVPLSLVQQRQTSLANLWGSAASFGIASFLFQFIPKLRRQHQQQPLSSRLDKQLHFGLLVFCTLGLVAIPGEFGMKLVVMDTLASSSPLPRILPQCISVVGLLVATVARITGFWTAIHGLQASSTSSPSLPSPSPTTGLVESDQIQNSTDVSILEPSSIPTDPRSNTNWLQRLLIVPKSYRKQTLFYRNIMLVLMTAAGSNLMEGLFRWRYRSALAQPFSALDISLSISAGARLIFFTILMYALKVGSESLPPMFLPTTTTSFRDSNSNNENPSSSIATPTTTSTTTTWTMSQRQLAKSMSKLNLLVATWALVVSLGQTAMKRQSVSTMAKPEILLVFSGILAIKGYRLWLLGQGQSKDTSQ